jgi:hypothetical protein
LLVFGSDFARFSSVLIGGSGGHYLPCSCFSGGSDLVCLFWWFATATLSVLCFILFVCTVYLRIVRFLITRKGCLISNVLDSSLDLCSNMFALGFRLGWCPHCFLILWCFRSVEICRSQGVWSASFPATFVLYQSLWLCLDCCARKSFYVYCSVHGVVGTWIMVTCWRLINSPVSNPFWFCWCSLLFFFFNLVSRPYAGLLGFTREKC